MSSYGSSSTNELVALRADEISDIRAGNDVVNDSGDTENVYSLCRKAWCGSTWLAAARSRRLPRLRNTARLPNTVFAARMCAVYAQSGTPPSSRTNREKLKERTTGYDRPRVIFVHSVKYRLSLRPGKD